MYAVRVHPGKRRVKKRQQAASTDWFWMCRSAFNAGPKDHGHPIVAAALDPWDFSGLMIFCLTDDEMPQFFIMWCAVKSFSFLFINLFKPNHVSRLLLVDLISREMFCQLFLLAASNFLQLFSWLWTNLFFFLIQQSMNISNHDKVSQFQHFTSCLCDSSFNMEFK